MQDTRPAVLKPSPPRAVAALLAAACLVMLSVGAGCSDGSAGAAGSTSAAAAEGVTIQLAVEGMHCTGCAATIEVTVAGLPGVRSCSASFEQGAATVVAASATDADAIIRAIDELGYHARLDDTAAPD